jgi:hypothetical protein
MQTFVLGIRHSRPAPESTVKAIGLGKAEFCRYGFSRQPATRKYLLAAMSAYLVQQALVAGIFGFESASQGALGNTEPPCDLPGADMFEIT